MSWLIDYLDSLYYNNDNSFVKKLQQFTSRCCYCGNEKRKCVKVKVKQSPCIYNNICLICIYTDKNLGPIKEYQNIKTGS